MPKRIGFALQDSTNALKGGRTRAGSYGRSLHTVAGEVNLKVPN
jgi:hypothetical protein